MDQYLGEIRMFAGGYAPEGWAFCSGQIIPIAENEALYTLIGTTYGGDGLNNFALPDLRGRIPVHMNGGYTLGQTGGVEEAMLAAAQMPAHTHVPQANLSNAEHTSPENNVWARNGTNPYVKGAANGTMNPAAIAIAGGSKPHDNMMPFLAVSFIIALTGIWPPRD